MKAGLTLPNRTWELWAEEEIQAIIALRPEVVQVLVFHQQPDFIWAGQKRQLLVLFQSTGCEFEYRLCGIGPSDDPQHIADWAKVKLHGLPVGKVIPGNEFTHPVEGWIGSDWVAWLRRFGTAWNGEHELITPALSPNFEPYLDDMEKMAALVWEEQLYDYLGVHVYSNDHIVGLGNVPVCVTECNGDLPERVFEWVKGSEEAIWFSSKWIDPDPGYHWDLIGNDEFSASFKRWEEEVAMPDTKHLEGAGECPMEIFTLLQEIGTQYGVPYLLLLAVSFCESSWQADAINVNPASFDTNETRDYGLFQINGYWHPDFNLGLWPDARYNTQYACDLMLSRYHQTEDWHDAIQPWATREKAWDLYQSWTGEPSIEALKARIQFLEQENATLKNRVAAQQAFLAKVQQGIDELAALIRLNL